MTAALAGIELHGGLQQFTVPAGVTRLGIAAWGANGGEDAYGFQDG